MKNESLEFQPISKGKDSTPLVRKSFRIPVSYKESVQVIIRKKKYAVYDINQEGIGINPDDKFDFESNEILTPCELMITHIHLTGLTGRVIHCSSAEPGQLQYGIQWVDLGPKEKEKLKQILLQMKAGVLKNQDRMITPIY